MTKAHSFISPAQIAKLPKNERDTPAKISDILWKKSRGKCYLCGGTLNRASDRIVPDHDIPEIEGKRKGEDVNRLKNLNLTHAECNAFKRGHPTAPASSFLPFRRFLRSRGGTALYSDCLKFFEIDPKKTEVTVDGEQVHFEFPDGSVRTVQLLDEENLSGTFHACFVDVPIAALFHDVDCQPRSIKEKQVWLIFSDLQRNPLHEPPACRVTEGNGQRQLLMFDGQHKTVASLLMKRTRIPLKVYLGISIERTRHLVNSIQSKIPKLSLSAFELMAKMGAEYHDLLAEYTESAQEPSELGFLNSVAPDQRARAKQAFENACLAALWDDPDLVLDQLLKQSTGKGRNALTEKKIKEKLLRPLLYLKPLQQPFEESNEIRERERDVVIDIVNEFAKRAFQPAGKKPAEHEADAIERRQAQASIDYCARLVRKAVAHELSIDEDECLGRKKIKSGQAGMVKRIISRVVGHEVWTDPFSSQKMRAVQDALSKNQNYEAAFKAVGLNIGYALTGES